MEGPRRSRLLDEEEQQLADKQKEEEMQERFYESAATVCLSKLELQKKKDGIVHVFIKGSMLTGETLELVAIDEEHQQKINAYRLPKKPFVKPVSASVAEFRRINKLFETIVHDSIYSIGKGTASLSTQHILIIEHCLWIG